jgi:hypothetical protein
MRPNYFRNESQDLLNRNVNGFLIFFYLLFSMVVFTPLWLYGFYLEHKIFGMHYKGLNELLIVVGMSVVIYWVIYFLKGVLIAIQEKGSGLWVLLLILYMGLFVGMPVWFYFVAFRVSANLFINFFIAAIIAASIYSHFDFHKPGSSILGRPGYYLGRWFGEKI